MNQFRKYAAKVAFIFIVTSSCQTSQALDWDYWVHYIRSLSARLRQYASAPLCSVSCGDTRPKEVQAAVDQAFEKNKNTGPNTWHYDGDFGWYGLCAIDEEVLVKHLVSLKKRDVYIIDVGCAQGEWGRNVASILQKQHSHSDTTFHILSITGGQECQEKELRISDTIILHQLNQFKIENIDEELAKRGFDLENKVDLIVSRWTLRHLVDPFGTLARMYKLLTTSGGKLLTNGFLFVYEDKDSKKIEGFPSEHPYMLAQSNAHVIFHVMRSGRDVDSLCLERNDERPLGLPLRYTGSTRPVGWRYQCQSYRATEFFKNKDINDKWNWKKDLEVKSFQRGPLRGTQHHYFVKGDERSEKLYASLKEQGLFDEPESVKLKAKL